MSTFLQLPVDADEGFPQSFRLALDGRAYVFGLLVSIAEEVLPTSGPGGPFDLDAVLPLPGPAAYLVLTVAREDSGGSVTLLRRKVVPGHVLRAGELDVVVRTVRIARGNLHGAGRHGSEVVAGVAVR
jgi:hypothetical protein